MLYISRRVGSELYGVVDTDDGAEDIVYVSTMEMCVKRLGLHIEGAERFRDMFQGERLIPYQLPSTLTRHQIKTKMLYGVDVKVFNSVITSILWDGLKEPVTLRLSDFGDSIGDCVLFGHEVGGGPTLTLIIDDKIKSLSFKSFMVETWNPSIDANGSGVVLDVRELSDYQKVELVKKSAAGVMKKNIEEGIISVIDRDDR